MRTSSITAILFGLVAVPLSAQQSCLDPANLIRLDSHWERALLESDVAWLTATLAEDFIWIHNHASGIDSKARLLERTSNTDPDAPNAMRSRTQSDVEARVLGSTGLVTGFTVVVRGSVSTRYNFMRTYVEVNGRCRLLGNHTMVVPDEGG